MLGFNLLRDRTHFFHESQPALVCGGRANPSQAPARPTLARIPDPREFSGIEFGPNRLTWPTVDPFGPT